MFRRRTSSVTAGPDTGPSSGGSAPGDEERPARTAGKGRPTPKRSEAERRRRPPVGASPADRKGGRAAAGPKLSGPDRKAATARSRADARTRREANLLAMRRGEQTAFGPRDRGPVKQLARDYVDSRRLLLSEYVLFGLFALIIAVVLLSKGKSSAVILLLELVILSVVAAEGAIHGSRVIRLARKRYPGQSTRGLAWYVTKRSIRIRGTRMPPPRNGITRGGAI